LIAATSFLCAKIGDSGGHGGDMVHTLAQWWHPVASNVAQDVLHWVMHAVSYRQIAMAIKTARERGVFFCYCQFVVVHKST
jgi:hypothetical protein